MFGQGFNSGFFGKPKCFTDTTDIFKDNSGVALYTLDYDASAVPISPGTIIEGAPLKIHLNTTNSSSYNGSGSTWTDLTSSNYDATLVSSPSYNSSNGGYLDFDGSADYGTFSSTAASDLQNDTYGSIEVWVYGDTWSGGNSRKTIFGTGHSSNTDSWSALRITPTNGIQWSNWNGSTDRGFRTGVAPPTGEWLHIVVTTTASGVGKIYLNGVSQTLIYGNGSAGDGSVRWFSHVSSNTLQVGALDRGSHGNNYDPFNGRIAQVRYYTSTLTDAEVLQNYSATKYNYANYDGTPSNVDFGVGGKSLYGAGFNGSNSYIDTNATLIPTNATDDFSISFWINPNNHFGTILARGLVSTGGVCYGFRIAFDGTNNRIRFNRDTGVSCGSTPNANTGNNTITQSVWNHVVIMYDASANTATFYINGSLSPTVYQNSNTGAVVSGPMASGAISFHSSYDGGVFKFGNRNNALSNSPFNGRLDQIRIFNKTLSSSEVSKLYGNGAGEIACEYTATTTDINYPVANLAYYKLDNNSKALGGNNTGRFNQGAKFVGSSTGIGNSTLQLSSTAHSISLWIKPEDLTASKWHIAFFSAFNGKPTCVIGKRPDRTTSFHYRNESSQEVYFTLSTANIWYHIVVTRNNSGSTVYVNGSSVATDSNSMGSYTWAGYQKTVIGSNPLYPAEYFSGTIDQVRVYNVALTATDVSNLYNNETVSTANTLSFPTGKTAIATYKLDGDGVDISGNYSGVDGSNIKYDYSGTDTNVEYRFGRFGQAAVFNGSSSYISAENPNSGGGARSFSAWIKTTSTGFQSIITNGGASHASGLNMFVFNNKLYSTSGNGSGENYGPTSSVNVNTGDWVHCALTMSGTAIGSTLKTYVNGVLDGTHTTTILITDTYDAFRIGGRYINGSHVAAWFNGQIDQVRIFNSELSSANITSLYNEKPETDTSNFKAVLYEGNGAARYISNVGMDLETNGGLVWLKGRDSGRDHRLFDSVRGATKGLYADLNHAEFTESGLDSFEKNGFFLGSVAGNNANNESFVAWNWKGGGLLNRSASFNGSSSRITLPKLSTITADVTVSGWLNLGNTTTSNRIRFLEINLDGNGYAGTLMVLYKPSNGQWVARAGNGTSSNSDVLTHTYTLTQSTWYHVCFTRDDSTNVTKFYINGSLQDTETVSVSSSYPSNATGVIGDLNYSAGSNYNWLGKIDQVRIFNKSLSSSEVTQLYNETVSTINTLQVLGDTSCVAAYPLGAGAGDLSNTYPGTPSNVTFNNPGHLTRNTSGTIESTVSANQDAGFSIVKYTSTGTSGSTVGHGLSSAPQIAIFKCISTTGNWITSITNVVSNKYLYLNNNGTGGTGGFSIDGTNITLDNTYGDANTSGRTYVAYCWHSVTGYSSIGTYTGTGAAGKSVTTGFQPSWLVVKRTNGTGDWNIWDARRGNQSIVWANGVNAEATNSAYQILFNSTGFVVNATADFANGNNDSYVYMAFK